MSIVTVHHRPDDLDRLSEAVLASFARPVSKPLYRGSVWIILMTALTLGLWPLWKSIRWLRDFSAVREQRCWHLAEWLRVNALDPDAAKLQALALSIRPNATILAVQKAAVIVAFVAAVTLRGGPVYASLYAPPTTNKQLLFAALTCGASLLLLLQLCFHQAQFDRFRTAFNDVLVRRRLPPVERGTTWGVNLLDWFGGAVLAAQGAAWPLFVIVSLGIFRRCVRRSLLVQAQIGDRVRDLIQSTAGPLRLPPRSDLLKRCRNERCGAVLKNGSQYCARCGKETGH